jgi:hypothetical protein
MTVLYPDLLLCAAVELREEEGGRQCSWSGLGEVPGTQAWSNESNQVSVIGHEVGHTFGLGHANSLPCNGLTIATNCPLARPEYGDPWDIMGNQSTAQVNAWQKNAMGWVPDAKVAKHPGGTASYLLSPLSSPGGTVYAVQVPGRRTGLLDRILEACGLRCRFGGRPYELRYHPYRRTHAPAGPQRIRMLGHVFPRYGAGDGDDVRRRACRVQCVRRLADGRDDHRRLDRRSRIDGIGREPADARGPGPLRKPGVNAPVYSSS